MHFQIKAPRTLSPSWNLKQWEQGLKLPDFLLQWTALSAGLQGPQEASGPQEAAGNSPGKAWSAGQAEGPILTLYMVPEI